MFKSLLPSRAGFALAVVALLMPVAINWASTVVSYTAVGQLNSDGSCQSVIHTNAANNPFVDPTGTAFLARAWFGNNSGKAVAPGTCQTAKP